MKKAIFILIILGFSMNGFSQIQSQINSGNSSESTIETQKNSVVLSNNKVCYAEKQKTDSCFLFVGILGIIAIIFMMLFNLVAILNKEKEADIIAITTLVFTIIFAMAIIFVTIFTNIIANISLNSAVLIIPLSIPCALVAIIAIIVTTLTNKIKYYVIFSIIYYLSMIGAIILPHAA